MEAKDLLMMVVQALQETKSPITRTTFLNVLMGRKTPEVTEAQLYELECFGRGADYDEEMWKRVIDAALEQGYVRIRSQKKDTIDYTAQGKAYLRKPVDFVVDMAKGGDAKATQSTSKPEVMEKKVTTEVASPKTKLQIKLIHAVDRKMALDDFAETEGVALEDVLDELEMLQAQGRKLDITYFTDEVIGAEDMRELSDFFDAESDDLDRAMREYGDVYHVEEIRLARFSWRNSKK